MPTGSLTGDAGAAAAPSLNAAAAATSAHPPVTAAAATTASTSSSTAGGSSTQKPPRGPALSASGSSGGGGHSPSKSTGVPAPSSPHKLSRASSMARSSYPGIGGKRDSTGGQAVAAALASPTSAVHKEHLSLSPRTNSSSGGGAGRPGSAGGGNNGGRTRSRPGSGSMTRGEQHHGTHAEAAGSSNNAVGEYNYVLFTLRQQVSQLERQLGERDTELAELKRESSSPSSLQAQVASLTASLAAAETKAAKSAAEVASLRAELVRHKATTEALEHERRQAREQSHALVASIGAKLAEFGDVLDETASVAATAASSSSSSTSTAAGSTAGAGSAPASSPAANRWDAKSSTHRQAPPSSSSASSSSSSSSFGFMQTPNASSSAAANGRSPSPRSPAATTAAAAHYTPPRNNNGVSPHRGTNSSPATSLSNASQTCLPSEVGLSAAVVNLESFVRRLCDRIHEQEQWLLALHKWKNRASEFAAGWDVERRMLRERLRTALASEKSLEVSKDSYKILLKVLAVRSFISASRARKQLRVLYTRALEMGTELLVEQRRRGGALGAEGSTLGGRAGSVQTENEEELMLRVQQKLNSKPWGALQRGNVHQQQQLLLQQQQQQQGGAGAKNGAGVPGSNSALGSVRRAALRVAQRPPPLRALLSSLDDELCALGRSCASTLESKVQWQDTSDSFFQRNIELTQRLDARNTELAQAKQLLSVQEQSVAEKDALVASLQAQLEFMERLSRQRAAEVAAAAAKDTGALRARRAEVEQLFAHTVDLRRRAREGTLAAEQLEKKELRLLERNDALVAEQRKLAANVAQLREAEQHMRTSMQAFSNGQAHMFSASASSRQLLRSSPSSLAFEQQMAQQQQQQQQSPLQQNFFVSPLDHSGSAASLSLNLPLPSQAAPQMTPNNLTPAQWAALSTLPAHLAPLAINHGSSPSPSSSTARLPLHPSPPPQQQQRKRGRGKGSQTARTPLIAELLLHESRRALPAAQLQRDSLERALQRAAAAPASSSSSASATAASTQPLGLGLGRGRARKQQQQLPSSSPAAASPQKPAQESKEDALQPPPPPASS